LRIFKEDGYWAEKIKRIKNPVIRKYLPYLLGLSAITIIILTAISFLPRHGQINLSKTYSDDYLRFSHPKSWQEIDPRKMGYKTEGSKVFKLFADPFRKNFLVYVVKDNDIEAVPDFKKFEEEMRETYGSLYPGTKIISISPYKIDGRDGLKIIMDYRQKNSIFTKAQYVTFSKRHVFWFTMTSSTKRSESSFELIEQILGTLKFKSPW